MWFLPTLTADPSPVIPNSIVPSWMRILVLKHYRRLWRVLFPEVAWPGEINFSDPNGGWGMQFFDAFENAA